MKKFSSLLHNLILTPSRNTKIKLLQDYFKILDINRAYALAILSDQLSFQFIKASKLKELVYKQVDQHLFDYSYDYVGDLAEAISLIWPTNKEGKSKNLSTLIENIKKNKNVSYINNYYEVTKNFEKLTQKGDLILNMGAGDCHNFWSILNEKNN